MTGSAGAAMPLLLQERELGARGPTTFEVRIVRAILQLPKDFD